MFKTTDTDTLKQDKRCQPCWYIVLSTMSGITTNNLHIHSHLDIFTNSQNYTTPFLTSITNRCIYLIQTHDSTGIIHAKLPVNKTFPLI